MGLTHRRRFRFPTGNQRKGFVISALWLLAGAALWYGVLCLDDAYRTSRFTVVPPGCPLARLSAWNTEVGPVCWGAL